MTKAMASKVEEIGQFFRSEWLSPKHFEGWPGLPDRPGTRPSRYQANYFLLGCCVEYMTITSVAWENARRFCEEAVPEGSRSDAWSWIAGHSPSAWARKHGACKPHRFESRHAKLHSIARIVKHRYHGDARRIWEGRDLASVLAILEHDLKVGPAIARMIVGALRDHRLIHGKVSDFKPDRWVIRLMKGLGLAASTRVDDVLKASRLHFRNPWLADICLYHLGADYEVETRQQFLKAYEAVCRWKGVHRRVKGEFKALLRKASDHVGDGRWIIHLEHTYHWAGAYLVRKDGPLAPAMSQEGFGGLWLWIGVGFDGKLVATLDAGGNKKFFESQQVKRRIRRAGLKAERQGPAVAKGAAEFWRSWSVSSMAFKGTHELVNVLKRAVTVCNGIVSDLEGAGSKSAADT